MLQQLNLRIRGCLISLRYRAIIAIGLMVIMLSACAIPTVSQEHGFNAPWYKYGSIFNIAGIDGRGPPFCVGSEHRPFVNKINEAAEGIYYFAYTLAWLGTEKLNGTDKPYESLYYSVSPDWNNELKAMNAENKSTNSDKVWKLRFPPHDAVQFPSLSRLKFESKERWGNLNALMKNRKKSNLSYKPLAIYNFKLRSDDEIEFLILYYSDSIEDRYMDSYVFKRNSDGRWRFQSHGQEAPVLWSFNYKFEDAYPEGYPVPRLAHILQADIKGLAKKGYECAQ